MFQWLDSPLVGKAGTWSIILTFVLLFAGYALNSRETMQAGVVFMAVWFVIGGAVIAKDFISWLFSGQTH